MVVYLVDFFTISQRVGTKTRRRTQLSATKWVLQPSH